MTAKVEEDEIPPLLDYIKAAPNRFANKLQASSEATMKEPHQQQTAFIDRIEDGIAILILSDETLLDVPRQQLPAEAKAGDYLHVTFDAKTGNAIDFALDNEATSAAQARVAELQAELSADDDAAPMNIKL